MPEPKVKEESGVAANATGRRVSVRRAKPGGVRTRTIDSVVRVYGEDEILTSREAREFLKIGRTKLWELTRSNNIPAYRVGHGRSSGLRYKRQDLLAWLERNRI